MIAEWTRFNRATLAITQLVRCPEAERELYESEQFGMLPGWYPPEQWRLESAGAEVMPVKRPAESPILSARREAMQRRLRQSMADHATVITAKYSPTETQGFPIQEAEARAALAGATGPLACIDGICAETGKTRQQIAERIVAKADEYAAFYGRLVGWRQKKEAEIDASEDPETVRLDDFA